MDENKEGKKEAKSKKIDFVMIGDSITHSWSKHPEILNGNSLLNLGFPGISYHSPGISPLYHGFTTFPKVTTFCQHVDLLIMVHSKDLQKKTH